MRGEGGVVGEGELLGYQSFIPGVSAPCHEYQPRLDVKCFLWPMNHIALNGSFISHLGVQILHVLTVVSRKYSPPFAILALVQNAGGLYAGCEISLVITPSLPVSHN